MEFSSEIGVVQLRWFFFFGGGCYKAGWRRQRWGVNGAADSAPSSFTFLVMMEAASVWSSCARGGSHGCPREPGDPGAALSIVAVPAVVNHLPPPGHPSPPLPISWALSHSRCPALICTLRLIRARGPWWNLAVIGPNFSNIFYCLHHSFTGGRWRGECVCVC